MPENPSGFARWLLVLAAGLVVVSVLGYRVWSRNRAALVEPTPATIAPAEPVATVAPAVNEPAPAASSAASTPEPASAAAASASAEAAASASADAPNPEPAPSAASAATAESSAPVPAQDIRKVTVKSKPPKVRFFHFGKPVGVTPFVLELKPGERHAYEAGLPGYNTRKVVIDGSKPQVTVGLTREKP